MNGAPAKAGASLVPLISCRWQGAQLVSNCCWPDVACAAVKGPVLEEFAASWPKARVPSAATRAKPAPASRRVLLRIFILSEFLGRFRSALISFGAYRFGEGTSDLAAVRP